MVDTPFSDPLAWRPTKAPSLDDIEVLAREAFQRLPDKFRTLCEGLIIRVEDFPTEEVLDDLDAETEFDLLGLFQGVGLPFQSESAPTQMPNMIWLYRRPILDYWAEHDESLGAIITHVLVHEIGHHFGFSDEDMTGIEQVTD
jgi:predicted Zn-dependent protease with MMP-like domain